MMLTASTKYIHYAIEKNGTDGAFLVCETQSSKVVRTLMAAWQKEMEEDWAAYEAASSEEQECWVFPASQRVIPFEAGHAIWLGFPFGHLGAKEWKEEVEGVGVVWPEQEADFREILRQQTEGDWL